MQDQILYEYALTGDGKVVHAETVERGSGPFVCPDHGCEMILKRGEIKRAHFAHVSGEGYGCSVESAAHKAAKAELCAALEDDTARPSITTRCWKCGRLSSPVPISPGLRGTVEFRKGARWMDVAVMSGDDPRLFIECRETHKIDRTKALDLDAFGLPWIEVKAQDVLRDPLDLQPVFGSKEYRTPCLLCSPRTHGGVVVKLNKGRWRCDPCQLTITCGDWYCPLCGLPGPGRPPRAPFPDVAAGSRARTVDLVLCYYRGGSA